MAQPKTVRLSGETLDLLEKHGRPFESPDECLKRILSKKPCKTEESKEDEIQVEK